MLNTTPLDTAETRLGAAYAVEQYLHRHGASLCDLLDALDDPAGFSALCDLHGAFSQPFPDPEFGGNRPGRDPSHPGRVGAVRVGPHWPGSESGRV